MTTETGKFYANTCTLSILINQNKIKLMIKTLRVKMCQKVLFPHLFSVIICILTFLDVTAKRQIEVIVIGGGIAGLAAARQIKNDKSGNYSVTVFEARRERYGGRIWTDRQSLPKARGVEIDLGGSAINSQAKNNSLMKLVKEFELETTKFEPMQVTVSSKNKRYEGSELIDAFRKSIDVLVKAVEKIKSSRKDKSVKDAITEELAEQKEITSDSLVMYLLRSLPSYNIENYSSLLYSLDSLDFGYDTVIVDGMGEIADRLVAGSDSEMPFNIELRKIVRHIQVDTNGKRVLVRTKDRMQHEADAIIVAVPSPVIVNKEILFDPSLPREYMDSLHDIGMSSGNKVIVQFEEAFWPSNIGIFFLAPESEEDQGYLQIWINIHKVIQKPYLIGFMFGSMAEKFETLSDEEVRATVKEKLSKLFGAETVARKNITKILKSNWNQNKLSGGAGSYPKVGNSARLWDVLSEPLCPYIYFAGEHTIMKGQGTLHGAYNSGLRAADQLMTGYCTKKLKDEARKKQEKEKREKEKKTDNEKTGKEKTENKKDEL